MSDQKEPQSNPADGVSTGGDAGDDFEQLRSDLSEAKDRALRAHAELENYRKRIQRDMESERKFANYNLLHDLLPVIDNTGRAIEAAEKSPEAAAVATGFKMVAQQLEQVLERYHCQRIPALHQPFDPHLHQAISQQPNREFPPGTVIIVAQDGYQLYDRVLRPAQVIVSTAPEQ